MKNDELKEKLKLIDGFFNKAWACDLDEVYHAVIDTITNLKQENERLKKENEMLELNKVVNIANYVKDMADYKSRCEKAVEYIQNHQLVFELSSKKVISQWFDMFYKDTLNILNGRSDE